ncbi:MAG: methyltransferase domain-containing protein [Acidimicrobiales bacterium]|nr:methyltransferase domain-containing protein [Acidimicrobiales bacterium]
MHESTLEAYERIGGDYAVRRGVQDPDRAERLASEAAGILPRRVLDLGCGPGHYLRLLGPSPVGADAVRSMVEAARSANPTVPVVRCDLARLPFGRHTFSGVWASKAHQHLPGAHLPLALAEVHRVMSVGGRLELTVFTHPSARSAPHGVAEEVSTPDSGDDIPGRWFTWWDPDRLAAVVTDAAFAVEDLRTSPPERSGVAKVSISARAVLALPDHVGPGMRLLCCGINPSVHAAEAGVGYVTGSNRFWPALQAAGLCDVPRDPRRLLRERSIGMTDLVKRPTPRASDLTSDDYVPSLDRLARLCSWLEPRSLVVVGIGPWRVASGDRKAVFGWQPHPVGPTPVYVMPSTSGLNARVSLAELASHLRAAAAGP